MRRVGWLAPLLLAGCAMFKPPPAPPPPFACPQLNGPLWLELTSPHFDLRTSNPERFARHDIQAMEDLLLAIRGAVDFLLPGAAAPSRTSVVVLADAREIAAIMPPNTEAFASPIDDHGRPTIVLANGNSQLVFRHELTHRLVFQRLPRAQAWLNEGLAEYFMMVQLEKGVVHLGIPTPRVKRLTSSQFEKNTKPGLILIDEEMPTLGAIMGADEKTLESDEKFYIAAWAAVHFLANGGPDHPHRFRLFLRAIAAGTDTAEALVANYGSPSALEARYREYLRGFTGLSVSVTELAFPLVTQWKPVTPTVRALSDAEVHRLWSFFYPRQANRQLELARQHDPQSSSTQFLEAQHDVRLGLYEDALAALDRAVAAPPKEPFLVAMRLSLRVDLMQRLAPAARDLASLAPDAHELAQTADETFTLLAVAQYAALSGDVALGLPAVERAIAFDPNCFECLMTSARLHYAKGDFAGAVEQAELGVHRFAKPGGPPWASLDRLKCYRDRAAGHDVDCAP